MNRTFIGLFESVLEASVMYIRMVGGNPHPRTWQEYEDLVIRSAKDPNIVIALRPDAWQEYERQFFRGSEVPDYDFYFVMAETPDNVWGC